MGAVDRWRGKRVLVTGGTGFIGRHVTQLGLAAGVEIHNLSRGSGAQHGVINHPAKLEDRQAIFGVVQEVRPDAVIHLAAAGVAFGSVALDQLLAGNAVGTENLLAALEATAPEAPVVLAGSCLEYKMQDRPISEAVRIDPHSEYGVSKAAASLVASVYAKRLSITVLRLFSLYGPGEAEQRFVPHIIGSAMRREAVQLTPCEQVRDYIYVEDAAACFWQALLAPPVDGSLQVYNVGSGVPVELRSLAMQLAAALEERGYTVELRFGAKQYRPGEAKFIVSDPSRARQLLAWTPQVSLWDGLRRTVGAMV